MVQIGCIWCDFDHATWAAQETRQPPNNTYDTLTVGKTTVANTHGTIHATTKPTNDVPRCLTYNTPTTANTTPAQSNP